MLPNEVLPPRSDKQDLTAQTQALLDLGVKADRIYTDHGFTGRNKARPEHRLILGIREEILMSIGYRRVPALFS